MLSGLLWFSSDFSLFKYLIPIKETFAHCLSFGYHWSAPSLGTPGGPTKPQHCKILRQIPAFPVSQLACFPCFCMIESMHSHKMPEEIQKSTATNKNPWRGRLSSLDKPFSCPEFGPCQPDPFMAWFCFHCYHYHLSFSHIPSHPSSPSLPVISPARATTSGSSRKLSASSSKCSTLDGPVKFASRQGG